MLNLAERFVYKGDCEKLVNGQPYSIDAMTWPGKGEFRCVASDNECHGVYLVYSSIRDFFEDWEEITK